MDNNENAIYKRKLEDKRTVMDSLTKAEVPEGLKPEVWHFTSNLLSSSFFSPKDEKELEDIFWITNYFQLKELLKESINVPAPYFQHMFQVFHHAKTRFRQSVGTLHRSQTNLAVLLTKIFQVIEQTFPDSEKKHFMR